MAGNLLRLLVIFFSISGLICLNNAVPLTRLGRLMHGQEPNQVVSVPENNPLQVTICQQIL
uniref:Uncharacterized protein MANES_06G091700 n=1 Tax=Rhizophora mucronata TaxID=61149 RepID=A0A2P2JER1_RHIMU